MAKQFPQSRANACLHHQFRFSDSDWPFHYVFVGHKTPSEAFLEEKICRGPSWFLKVKLSL